MTVYTSSLLDTTEGLRYRFFTRENGVSEGAFASLNCGETVGDKPENVRENLRRVARNLHCGRDDLFLLHQTHSSVAVTVTADTPKNGLITADASVTCVSGVFLCIKTADCAPVLFADAKNGVVGAAHAGWRGAVGGVLENTIKAMTEIGAEREHIAAVIGPCIAPQSYTVGRDMVEQFEKADPKASLFFVPADEYETWRFDLAGYVLARLDRAQIGAAEWVGADTYALKKEFFSYRRSKERNETCGRQLSVIGLVNDSFY